MELVQEKRGSRSRIFKSKSTTQQVIILGVLILLLVILSFLSDKFLTSTNILNVLRQASLVIITGCGASFLLITGNMDLSTGSTLAFCGVLSAILASKGVPVGVAMLAGVIVGVGIGAVNGVCVTVINVPPVITTMGSMYAVRGLAFIICGGISVNHGLPDNFEKLGRSSIAGIPTLVLLMLVVVLIFMFLQKKTILGKYTYAAGGNRTAAILSGIRVNQIVLLLYSIVGGLAGVSGVLMASRLGAGDPSVASNFHFDVIIAMVLGGTNLRGGEGTITGVVIGALIIEFLGNGLNLMNVASFYQDVLKGVVLVLAVILTGAIQRRFQK